MRRPFVLIAVICATLIPASPAVAGVLTTAPFTFVCYGSSGDCPRQTGDVAHTANVTYNAVGDPSSHITVEGQSWNGALLLTDSGSRITLAGTATAECTLLGPHAATCVSFSLVTVRGGNHGDVIDARKLFGAEPTLEGGNGNDVIYAAQDGARISAGAGHNLLVGGSREEGGSRTTVSYEKAGGPVTVDLARGVGVSRHERDRLVRISDIVGSNRYSNRILGPRGFSSLSNIVGGQAGNYLVARAASIVQVAKGPHRPSTVVCENGRSEVSDVGASDVISGTCDVGHVHLFGSIRNTAAPFLSAYTPQWGGFHMTRVTVVALPSGAPICEIVKPETYIEAECRLSAPGRALLQRLGHMGVRVTEFDNGHPEGSPHEGPFIEDTFRYVLALRKR